jgi:pilus assembly protein Flp/PilA
MSVGLWEDVAGETKRAASTFRGGVMKATILRFIRNESGATAIEYGLIAAGISVAIIAVVQGLGTNLNNTFQSVSTALK